MSEVRFPDLHRKRKAPPAAPPPPGTAPAPSPSGLAAPGELRFVLIDSPGSGAPDRATLAAFCAAISRGMREVFAPIYNKSAQISVGDQKDLGDDGIPALLIRDLDEPGALGFHEGRLIKVSPFLDAQDGANLSTTLDHEVKEATEDLTIDLARGARDGRFWADEACDATESQEFEIDGVPLSNFVCPGWYSGIGANDYLRKLAAPLTVGPGGYAQWFDPDKGWQQVTHASVRPRAYRRRKVTRSMIRRARGEELLLAARVTRDGR